MHVYKSIHSHQMLLDGWGKVSMAGTAVGLLVSLVPWRHRPRMKSPGKISVLSEGSSHLSSCPSRDVPVASLYKGVSYSNHPDICPRFLINFATWVLWVCVGGVGMGDGKGRSANATTPFLHPWIQGNWRKRKKKRYQEASIKMFVFSRACFPMHRGDSFNVINWRKRRS